MKLELLFSGSRLPAGARGRKVQVAAAVHQKSIALDVQTRDDLNCPLVLLKEHSLVPLTLGSRRRDHDETSLVILFFDSESAQADRAARVVAKMDEYAEIDLIKTRRLVVEVRQRSSELL